MELLGAMYDSDDDEDASDYEDEDVSDEEVEVSLAAMWLEYACIHS